STVKNFAGVSREEQDEKLREMSRMNIRGNDEIAVLYDNMAEMAYQINSFVDQVVREQKLQEDLRVAQIASENKSNFLNNVSHEIRTPINAVLGLDEMILRESKEENIIEYAKDIQNSGKTLLSLVNDILDSSKLESGKMEILPVEYDVSSVINDIVNMIGVRAKDKHLGFELHVDSKIPHILYGDEIRIKQVIVNILTNAVKYTEKGQVDFTLGFEKENEEEISLICKVKDTGIGIKKEDMDKLFSRFERIDEGRNRTIEGTGLGMNIVKQLLALMDSELEVESEYGVGSEFSFKVRQKVVSWDEMGDYAESYRRFVKNEHYKESFIAPDAIVLVTDDTVMNLTVFKALLKTTKVQIDTAESGFETLDKVKEKKYDIIFLDHRMPQMDGIETLQKMKELEGNLNTDTPVISLTANAVSGARETYMAAGFADYLSKPIDSKKLEHMIVDYLPKEKLIIESGDIAESNDTGESGEKEIIKSIRDQSALNLEEAFLNCGGEETFVEVLKEYVGSAEKKAGDIESFWQNLDYENYTVLVHALKSSSRLIGAGSLSEDAKELETLGNEAAAGNEDAKRSINEKTPALLEAYRSLYQSLSFVLGNDSEEDKPKIDLDGFKDGMNTIKEFVEAFDFDSADSVVKMLDMYQIPKEYKEGFAKVKEALSAVDQQLLIEKIREMGL
nr:response regulator [Lachnospiraceae bacterium]